MKFYLPAAETDEDRDYNYNAIVKFAKMTTGWNVADRKIRKITYHREGKDYFAEVGKANPMEGELVIAILESNTYLICTPSRGVVRGEPYFVGKDEIYTIEDFDK